MTTPIRTRNSVMAITVESTEGTLVQPSAAGEYIALQQDATMAPNREVLTNDEIKQSLAQSEPITARETATASMSHYLKASGTEGVAAETDEIHTALFGAEEIESTEYDTVAGSTTSVLNVDTGEGAQFAQGQAVLVKDAVNGFSVRNVQSISSDALTLGFDLSSAPASGVNLGKSVFYSPANSGHQTLSILNYLGNEGAIQAISGARCTQMDFTVEPGSLINASYSFEGLKYFFNPITITASDIYIDFTDDQGTAAAVITAKTYKSPKALATAIESAMNAVTTETITCTYSDTAGTFTIATSTSTVFSILWNTGSNAANTVGDKIGFSVAADDTGATSYTSDSAISFAAAHTPAYDASQPLKGYYQQVLLGDSDDITCLTSSSVSGSIVATRQPFDDICAESGFSNSIVNARSATFTITALLKKYEADKFRRFSENTTTRFCLNVGERNSLGNWTPGSIVNIYSPSTKITSFSLTDLDGLVGLELELQTFTNAAGDGEIFLNML